MKDKTMPKVLALRMDEVSIRCMGCFQQATLEEAVRAGWQMCQACNFPICPYCYGDLGTEKICISHICSGKRRILEPVPLPIDKIIIFAQENYQTDYHKGMLYKLFYQESERQYAPPFFAVQEKPEQQATEEQKPSKVQQEVWKNFQLVITKRRGGKFITWERVV